MKARIEYWATGIVVVDKPENDKYIKVYPQEITPLKKGNIENISTMSSTIDTSTGDSNNIVVNRSDIITAKWLPRGDSNRMSAPCVHKGETVRIYRYGNTNKYYWNTMYNELNLRKNEKVIYAYSNKSSISNDEGILKKSYYHIVDTINKFLTLHTSKNDGEYCEYDIDIDTKSGVLIVKDDVGNHIELTSKDGIWDIKSTNKVHIDSPNVIVDCEVMTVNAKHIDLNYDTMSMR